MGVNLGMKKYWYVVVLAVSLFLLGACVTDTTSDTTPPPPSYPRLVDDLEDVSESDSPYYDYYVVTVLSDPEVMALIEDVSAYVAAQATEPAPTSTVKSVPELMAELTPDATGIEGARNYYNGLMNVFRQHAAVEAKLRNMVTSSKELVGVTDLEVEITGKAKEDIINSLNDLIAPGVEVAIEAPDTLILDYRDFMYLRALAGGLFSIYDSETAVNGWFDNLDKVVALMDYLQTGTQPEDLSLEDLFNGDALKYIGSFVEYLNSLEEGQYPLEISTTWDELDILVTGLAGIADPTNELNTADIFADGILQIGGMDILVDTLDYFIEIINGVYVFEVAKTDANGWRKDDKTSLFEYAMTLYDGDTNANISIKSYLDEDIPVEDMPAEITELKFGSVDLLQEVEAVDLVGELNEALPTGELVTTMKVSTSIQSAESEEIPFEVFESLSVDFGALSDGTLELLNNNLGVEAYIIDELIAIEIWDIIKADTEPTQEQIEQIISIILNNLTFIKEDNDSFSGKINIDKAIFVEVKIETLELQ